ncbi:YgfX family protein [Pseudidiomarina andamanensis]|uniref:Uncharacterized protein n=1 Tax=Pseudidiomarina andamanensis TaxID=1940690 RepID=A0AA92ESV8_9GAMM|nr:protein YgfX [Pseudidiomarina andamanensis]MDS0218205.1 hypothetical protein [Pseudidiomarina andamanensis]QGT95091.1 hypothetical protein D3795_02405 [Pseudidiomarina andamanensis]
MLWQLTVRPWAWLRFPSHVWGVNNDTGVWVQLDDLDQKCWHLQPLSWVTPWGALLILHHPNTARRWLWLPRSWLGDAQYRRLARFLLRWRQYGRLRLSQ